MLEFWRRAHEGLPSFLDGARCHIKEYVKMMMMMMMMMMMICSYKEAYEQKKKKGSQEETKYFQTCA